MVFFSPYAQDRPQLFWIRSWLRDPNHSVGFSVQPDALPQNVRISSIARLPETTTQDHYMMVSLDAVLRREIAAQYHPLTVHGEQTRSNMLDHELFRLLRVIVQCHPPLHNGAERLKALASPAPLFIFPRRNLNFRAIHAIRRAAPLYAVIARFGPQHHHPAAFGPAGKKNAVDDAEHGRVGTNPERDDEHGGAGESRVFEEPAEAILQVPPEPIHDSTSTYLIGQILHPARMSKSSERSGPRFLRQHPPLDVGLRLHLDVETHLFIDLFDHRVAPDERAQPIFQNAESLHTPPYFASRTFMIARASRSQLSSSTVN